MEVAELTGLSDEQVRRRVSAGDINRAPRPRGRSVAQILRANVFTVFNAILAGAVVVVLIVGQWQDAVFGLVLVVNTTIGTVAEIRAKRVLDAVSIVDQATARVIRGGAEREVAAADIVLGDLVCLRLGDQVPVDGTVRRSRGLTLDESILTGESAAQHRAVGERVRSGAAVTAGHGVIEADAVGVNAYAHRITARVAGYQKVRSELAAGLDRVLRWLSWVVGPLTLLVMWSQLRTDGSATDALATGKWRLAAVLAVAAVVGMIPQGLVLLTSMNFAVAAASLARRGAVVRELPAVEVLARVDVLCLDKTGTLTTGHMAVRTIDADGPPLDAGEYAAIAALVADEANATAEAVAAHLRERGVPAVSPPERYTPFSSARKFAAATIDGREHVLGAPDVVLAAADPLRERAARAAATGTRVVAYRQDGGGRALIAVAEQVRPDAEATFRYFAQQGVRLLVISGDDAATAGAIAARTGIAGGAPRIRDARDLPTDLADLGEALAGVDVLGRVAPEQKRDIVAALQARSHVVAMTGDGVNDALALKAADLGIAMGSGTRASKAVARLVLTDSAFTALPRVLGQGRRVMANMERVSALFLTKTVYAIVLALAVGLTQVSYPFLPRHLTIIGSLSIGIPAFFLALAPTNRRYRPGFLRRVLRVAAPAGVLIALAVLVAHRLALADWAGGRQGEHQAHTVAMLVALAIAFGVLAAFSRPLLVRGRPTWRAGLLAALLAAAVSTVVVAPLRAFAALDLPTWHGWAIIAGIGGLGVALVWQLTLRTGVRNGDEGLRINQ